MSDTPALRTLDAAAIDAALPMARAIDAMREAFRALSAGRAHVPVRASLPLHDADARLLVMPATMPGARVACVKIVSVVPGNARRTGGGGAPARPTIQGLLLAFDAVDGTPLARLDAERVTALRTGAASGLATRVMAPAGPQDAPRALALFGTGVQAAAQLEAMAVATPLRAVLVHGRDGARVQAFCVHWSARLGLPVRPARESAGTGEGVGVGEGGDLMSLRDCELVCTATTATEPLFEADALHPRAHVNAVGSYTPRGCELPPALLARADVVVDQRAACLAEAGEFVRARAEGAWTDDARAVELGLRLDLPAPPRTGRSVFKSVGNAVQDLACVDAILRASPTSSGGAFREAESR